MEAETCELTGFLAAMWLVPVLFHFLSATGGCGGGGFGYKFRRAAIPWAAVLWAVLERRAGSPVRFRKRSLKWSDHRSNNVLMAPALVVWPYKEPMTWRTSHTHEQPAESCDAFSCAIRGTCDFRELQDSRIDVLRGVLQGGEATGACWISPAAGNTRPTGGEFCYWIKCDSSHPLQGNSQHPPLSENE